jgi:formyl-CoA transferase
MPGPLAGVRVIDLTQFEAGPSGTQFLAWFGADVIKVEPPGGEIGRSLFERPEGRDSAFFLLFNQGKRSVVLDLATPEGRARLEGLLASADVFASNFAPGALERMGFAPERLRREHPRLVVATVRGYARGGPWADYKLMDMPAQAVGGAISVNGEAGGPPLRLGPSAADASAGMQFAIGILAALLGRAQSGRGCEVEVALQDAVVQLMRTAMVMNSRYGEPAPREGNDRVASAPSGLFPCQPGGPNDAVYLLTSTTGHWKSLAAALGREDLLADPGYARQSLRNQNGAALRAIVRDFTLARDKLAAMEHFSRFGVPCGAVLDTREIVENEQLRAARAVMRQEHPEWGEIWLPGCPISIDGDRGVFRPAPLLGEHDDAILDEIETPATARAR